MCFVNIHIIRNKRHIIGHILNLISFKPTKNTQFEIVALSQLNVKIYFNAETYTTRR